MARRQWGRQKLVIQEEDPPAAASNRLDVAELKDIGRKDHQRWADGFRVHRNPCSGSWKTAPRRSEKTGVGLDWAKARRWSSGTCSREGLMSGVGAGQ